MSTAMHILPRADDGELNCGSGGGADSYFGLRVAAIFIILVGSSFGALFPVLARRSSWLHVPTAVFDFAKYFGSGVIIATAFIHLLSPALDALSSECLAEGWQVYPYALALCMLSIFLIFIVELIAFRWGTKKLAEIGMRHDAHGHLAGSHAAHGPEGNSTSRINMNIAVLDSALTQIIGVAILEFGVALHSILIGLTLAVDEDFKVLFVVLVFHQTFEGLGIGSRLAYMDLTAQVSLALYGLTTPIGIAAGLGVRTTYNPGSTYCIHRQRSGILIYTGLVELLAHEFLFNKEMMTSSNGRLAYAIACMLAGCALMALLGRWA
ncbi:Zinc/iron permease [Desarmillaria tabescens]|uniref:Zinc/iron permease n=1 Tax=Armillaria tabescens TaxID=1929756 RepID=A0AA39U540_ARMTA|nr:Zinc/iron permease [Desarmillaria tabescens]KAK0467205.1 Zinc/iron permease [Desarmillaria tabescens]